ncbi:hypothetical protein ACKWTF_005209 [Chironomus riparius]
MLKIITNWDANFQLFKLIQEGEYENIVRKYAEIGTALSNITTSNIITTICSFFPEDQGPPAPNTYPLLFQEEEEDNENIFCLVQSLEFIQQFCHGALWPIFMVDSWAKIQSGFARGNIRNPGHFTQCINLHAPITNEYAGGDFYGKHVELQIGKYINGSFDFESLPPFLQFVLPNDTILDIGSLIPENLPLFIEMGICVPKICPNDLVLTITRLITWYLGLGPTQFTVNNLEAFTNVAENPPLGPMEWGAISLMLIGFVGVAISTIYEVVCLKLDMDVSETTAAMSLYSNGKYLFSMRQKKDNNMQCLYGLRALALIWLMLGYRFILPLILPLINPVDFILDFTESYFAPWVFGSQFGVDALLFVNGTLIAYLFMKKMDKSGHVKIWKLYIMRFMRVTPFIGILIFFSFTLTPYSSEGPYYQFLTGAQIPACEEYWWSAMLHVQNYVNPDSICLLHTYFFSIDMQLYWAAPLLLFPLYFLGPFILVLITIIVGLTIACAATISYYYGFEAFLFNNIIPVTRLMDYMRMIFFSTHIRMGPWLIGIMCGYLSYRLIKEKAKINWFISAFFWIVSISGIFTVIYLLYPFHQILDNNTSREANYLYIGFARNIFALCLAWFVIGCATGSGSVIRWLLSLSIWMPFAKMSISIYIVSLSAQMVTIASWKTPYFFGVSEMLQAFNSDILIVLLFSCMTFLMIERPIVRVLKVILRIGQNKESEKEGIDSELTFDRQSPWKSFY